VIHVSERECLACGTRHNVRQYTFDPYADDVPPTPLCKSCWRAIEVGGVPVPIEDVPARTSAGDST